LTLADIAAAPVVPDLERLALSAAVPGGLHMEFGVANGGSLRRLRKLLPASVPLYGFDSFAGLPEPWLNFGRGHFATPYRVSLPNTELVEGLFEVTLSKFLRSHREHISFAHIDCDLYTSTKTVLDNLADRIVPGTVILFDELFGFTGYERHEYRALGEAGFDFRFIGRWNAYRAAIQVVDK
jgi:hypothetical protein